MSMEADVEPKSNGGCIYARYAVGFVRTSLVGLRRRKGSSLRQATAGVGAMDAATESNPRSLKDRLAVIRTRAAVALSAVAVLGTATPANAQPEREWQHAFATYLMAAGMDGNVDIGTLTADANLSFSDLLDHLKLGMMMAYAAERGDWKVGIDAIYMNLEASKATPAGLQFDSEANQALISMDVAYRLRERVEVLAGLRYNDIETDLAVAGVTGGPLLASRSESWLDPYVGARYTLPLADQWTLTLRGDVGGFGVGSDSAWQFVSRFNWQLGDSLVMIFGYRVIDVDYDDGANAERVVFDVRSSGPVVGFGWRY